MSSTPAAMASPRWPLMAVAVDFAEALTTEAITATGVAVAMVVVRKVEAMRVAKGTAMLVKVVTPAPRKPVGTLRVKVKGKVKATSVPMTAWLTSVAWLASATLPTLRSGAFAMQSRRTNAPYAMMRQTESIGLASAAADN